MSFELWNIFSLADHHAHRLPCRTRCGHDPPHGIADGGVCWRVGVESDRKITSTDKHGIDSLNANDCVDLVQGFTIINHGDYRNRSIPRIDVSPHSHAAVAACTYGRRDPQ